MARGRRRQELCDPLVVQHVDAVLAGKAVATHDVCHDFAGKTPDGDRNIPAFSRGSVRAGLTENRMGAAHSVGATPFTWSGGVRPFCRNEAIRITVGRDVTKPGEWHVHAGHHRAIL